jgi:hypothetical protein
MIDRLRKIVSHLRLNCFCKHSQALFGFVMLSGIAVLNTNNAYAEKYRFNGFYASAVSIEALTPKDLELLCVFKPSYTDDKGRLFFFHFDISYFRNSGDLRYISEDSGWISKFDDTSKVIIMIPTKKFEGAEHYRPEIYFSLVQAFNKDSVQSISFRGFESFRQAIKSRNYKFGDRGVLVRCPFKAESYQKYSVKEGTVPTITEEASNEIVRLSWGTKSDPALFESVKKQLNK